jgi:predicted dehydrogenase
VTEKKRVMDRREFLVRSAGIGYLGMSASALTAWSATRSGNNTSNIYRVGIIGSTGRGDYGHEVDTAWLDFPNCEVVAVADDNSPGRAKTARRLNVQETFSDYREMLDKVKPDIASICPRWIDQHRDMAVAAAERGIHIYMEKPFCQTLEQADEVISACEASGSKLALALWTHYSPKLQTVRQLINKGAIGRVLEYRGRGKEDHRGGGEDLWVLGIHILDIIRTLAGQPKWCFAHLTQDGKSVDKRHVVDGNEGIGLLAGDSVQAMWGMPDSSTAYFSSNKNAKGDPSRYALQIFGTQGIFEIQEGILPSVKYLADPSWSPGRSGAKWQDVSSAGIGKTEPLSGVEYKAARHALAIRDLLEAIENDRQPLCNVYVARDVTEMIVSVFESHRVGKPVSLPLETRTNPLTI